MKSTSNVVVKNQFTNTNYQKHGSTPAQFVTGYTARDDATLTVYPTYTSDHTQINGFDFSSKLRKSIERLEKENHQFNPIATSRWGQTTSLEGRAFDKDCLSLSADRLVEKADNVQNAFDQHHTVHKIVVSFDTNYLEDHHLLRADRFRYHQSLKPSVDELRLRQAVQKGCQVLADQAGYTQPEFIGSIQLDQMHAHAHIVLCETAPRELSQAKQWYDGFEYGTFTDTQLDHFRDTIEHEIELSDTIPHVSSSAHLDYENHLKEYETQYANLDLVRDLMLSSAQVVDKKEFLEHKESVTYQDKLLTNDESRRAEKPLFIEPTPFDLARNRFDRKTHVAKELAHRNQVDNKTVEDNLDRQLTTSKKPLVELSPFISAQLFDINTLRRRKTKVAKLIENVKKVHEEQKKLQERFDVSTQGYLYFKRLEQEFEVTQRLPELELIREHIIPYYENRCIRDAIHIDQNRLVQYNPVEDPTEDTNNSYNKATQFITSARSPLDKSVSKRDYFIESVKQFNNGYLHADDFGAAVAATKDNRLVEQKYLPELKRTGSFTKDYAESLKGVDEPIALTFEKWSVDNASKALTTILKSVENETYVNQTLRDQIDHYTVEVNTIQKELTDKYAPLKNSVADGMNDESLDKVDQYLMQFIDDDTPDTISTLIGDEEIPDGDNIEFEAARHTDDELIVGLSYEDANRVAETAVSMAT